MILQGRRSVVALACLLAVSANGQAADSAGYTVKMPDFEKVLRPDEVITSLAADAYCLAVTDVRRVPDGWSVTLRADGESYRVELARDRSEQWLIALGTQEKVASNADVAEFAFRVAYRGQWSDCAGVRLSAKASGPDGEVEYSFDRGYRGQWEFQKRAVK